jgi:hypothetical protein
MFFNDTLLFKINFWAFIALILEVILQLHYPFLFQREKIGLRKNDWVEFTLMSSLKAKTTSA